MRIEDYSVNISPGYEINGEGYVAVPHNTQFNIILRNFSNKRATVNVKVNGDEVGSFRLNAGQILNLERPSKDNGKFTFYALGTKEGQQAGLEQVDPNSLGLIQAEFIPELITAQEYVEYPQSKGLRDSYDGSRGIRSYSMDSVRRGPGGQSMSFETMSSETMDSYYTPESYGSGGVGLSGVSNQRFKTVPAMPLDRDNLVSINLRLVEDKSDNPRPLSPKKGNKIPPPIA